MTKTIILVQGPADGRVETVPADRKQYLVIHPKPLKAGKIILSMQQGAYQQTGEYDGWGRELFLWQGWETG